MPWSEFRDVCLSPSQVVKARKEYGVKYPNLYAPESNKHADKFNSVQRAHQNTLESWPMVMTLMVANGVLFPKFSAACGAMWAVGRVIYGAGYASVSVQSN
eukprot:1185251-Amorphochlora_amoeboformis.AAC.3